MPGVLVGRRRSAALAGVSTRSGTRGHSCASRWRTSAGGRHHAVQPAGGRRPRRRCVREIAAAAAAAAAIAAASAAAIAAAIAAAASGLSPALLARGGRCSSNVGPATASHHYAAKDAAAGATIAPQGSLRRLKVHLLSGAAGLSSHAFAGLHVLD